MKFDLILMGGVSGVGKSTLVKRLEESTNIIGQRMFSVLLKFAELEGFKNEEMFKKLEYLENRAIQHLNEISGDTPIIIDLHYAIQPNLDTKLATGQIFEEDFNEGYVPSLSENSIKALCNNRSVLLLLIYAEPEIIEARRLEDEKKGRKVHRSLEKWSIEREIYWERYYFHHFSKIVSQRSRDIYNGYVSIDKVFNEIVEEIYND